MPVATKKNEVPIPLSIIITGVKTPARATEVHAIFEAHAANFPGFDVEVLHYCTAGIDIERSGMSEFEWLMYNAASRLYICHVDHEDISNFRKDSFTAIKEAITQFEGTTDLNTLRKNQSGRVQVPLPPGIKFPGCKALYFNVHNNTRGLRFMDAQFAMRLPRIALLIPITLKGIRDEKKIPILETFVPSLKASLSHTQIERGIYFGIDEDEVIAPKTLEILTNSVKKTVRIKVEAILSFPVMWRKNKNMTSMYNMLYKRAMMDGYDFAVQLQDDVRLETPRWDKTIASQLCANPLAVGAYSMCDRFNPTRLNNVMVSRTHFDIFGFLFNPLAPDPDKWIKAAMGPFAKVIPAVKVTNTIRHERRNKNGTSHMYAPFGTEDLEINDADRRTFMERYAKQYV